MASLHPLAQELNKVINSHNPVLLDMLCDRGRGIYFPTTGIIGQTAEAEGAAYNATIGIALAEDQSTMRLPSIDTHIDLDPGDVFPYANTYGNPILREKWKEMMQSKNPSLQTEHSLPVVTNGLTQALSVAAYLFLEPGESLILPDQFWGNYNLIFGNTYGTKLDTYNTFDGESLDLDSFRSAISDRKGKKVLVFNFPNNPTGYSPTIEEVDEMLGILLQRAEAGDQLVVLTDDAYFGLVYEEGIYEESLFGKLADLHENILAVKIDGATKEDYVWGFRVGFITFASKDITPEVCEAFASKAAGAVRGLSSNSPQLSQSLLLTAYNSPSYAEEKEQKHQELETRYRKVRDVLSDAKFAECFHPLPYNSGYFLCLKANEGVDTEKVRQLLLKEYDTGIVAIGDRFRIAYSSLPLEQIPQLFENLYQACLRISG